MENKTAKLEFTLTYEMYEIMKDNLLAYLEIEIMQGTLEFQKDTVFVQCEITDQSKIQTILEVTNRLMFHYNQTKNLN
jgi:hypothetical protein